MKYTYLFAVCVGTLLSMTVMPSRAQVSNDNEDGVYKVNQRFREGNNFVPGQVIVRFKDSSPANVRRAKGRFVSAGSTDVDAVLKQFGVKKMDKLFPNAVHKAPAALRKAKAPDGSIITESNMDQVYMVETKSQYSDSTLQLVKALNSLDKVEYAEPNYIAYISGGPTNNATAMEINSAAEPDDNNSTASDIICDNYFQNPLYNLQYGLTYEGLPQLWTKPIVNSERPVIAIIDTGVDTEHPDLKDNIWTNTAEAEGEEGYDNDNNGFVNDIHGWDFINNTGKIRDYNSHGTHCAGIAAACNNGIGIIGANPKALIMPVTVMQSDGTGDYATIAKGIDYAVKNGATILSMSLGGYTNSRVLREALANAYGSAVLVAAAGNDALAIYPQCGILAGQCFPAAYSFVLGVQATNQLGYPAVFSNYDCDGPNYSAVTSIADPEGFNYELSAPGVRIASTIPNGKYAYLSGTSMAAPLVAGAISALKMVKEYDSQEILWGDLTHSSNILEAYNITERPAELDFLGMQMRDRKDLADGEIDENSYATNDGEADAGETLSIYPIIRTTFGATKDITLRLEMGDEYEDTTLVDILTPTADFGMSISAYAKGVSVNPLVMKISDKCADARHIKMKVVATADGSDTEFEQPFTLTVSNMHKIGGLIDKDSTLTADKTWYVTENVGIMEGVTLTIEPGTRLEFAEGMGLSSFGKLVAKGTPEKPIIFTRHTGEGLWAGVKSHKSQGAHQWIYGNEQIIYRNADSTQFTLMRTEATPYNFGYQSSYYYYDPSKESNPGKDFNLSNYFDYNKKTEEIRKDSTLAYDPNFITTEVLQMLADWKAWNDTCKAKYSEYIPDVSEYFYNYCSMYSNIDYSWYDNPIDTLYYCKLSYCDFDAYIKPIMYDCEISDVYTYNFFHELYGERCNFINNGSTFWASDYFSYIDQLKTSNFVNNYIPRAGVFGDVRYYLPKYSMLNNSNYINTIGQNPISGKYYGKTYWIKNNTDTPSIDHADNPSYLGTAREDLVRPYCYEIENAPNTFGKIDLSNMLKEPVHEAHGIVWKVVVDGKDAQDEYEDLPPLGVGKHEFCVWFNRPMNVNVAPHISFGVRDPYTQVSVAEDGSWSADSTKYTAYITITGKTSSDGINQIYVYGAEDNEYFECPYEKTRFRVQVQAAGSMATGFEAEAALGRVNLKWNNDENDFTDAMGFNVYRISEPYQKVVFNNNTWQNDTIMASDTIRLNQEILPVDTTAYTDYAVTPGNTYYYYYKVLSTDLKEYDVSNVVACTPLTSTLGDANGSGDVDVADVITTVNYASGQEPKPFIYEAADVNTDKAIDILDVIGIIRLIINPSSTATTNALATATYTVEDGTLCIESPVALAGIQIQVSTEEKEISAADDMKGFENASAWLSDNDYIFLAYNMGGKTLSAGKHAILNIGDAYITSIRLSDAYGHNVEAVGKNVTKIEDVTSRMITAKGIFNVSGQKVAADENELEYLPKGVYIIGGQKVVK